MQSTSNHAYWLAAIHLEGIGPMRLHKWTKQLGSIQQLFLATESDLLALQLTTKEIEKIKNLNWDLVDRDLIWCEQHTCQLVSWDDADYPILLKEIASAPVLLFVQGDTKLLSQPQIAMVGSRNPTAMGRKLAEQFAYTLAMSELIITSGLAIGIDAASHEGALKAGGKTIAVCGGGLNDIYPSSNQALAQRIVSSGALVSEFPPHAKPRANFFPRRNRVISGLSMGVLIVEAALRSGSLITAQFALDQGREVFAVPGSIYNPLVRGCHQLIRQGAKLVESEKDVVEELNAIKSLFSKALGSKPAASLNQNVINLLSQIGYEVTSFDAIIDRSGLTAGEVSSMLLSLELEGYVHFQSGGYVRNA